MVVLSLVCLAILALHVPGKLPVSGEQRELERPEMVQAKGVAGEVRAELDGVLSK